MLLQFISETVSSIYCLDENGSRYPDSWYVTTEEATPANTPAPITVPPITQAPITAAPITQIPITETPITPTTFHPTGSSRTLHTTVKPEDDFYGFVGDIHEPIDLGENPSNNLNAYVIRKIEQSYHQRLIIYDYDPDGPPTTAPPKGKPAVGHGSRNGWDETGYNK